jgi:hypothetical protein
MTRPLQKAGLFVLAVLAAAGCVSVRAFGPTVVSSPTELIEDQRGDFLITGGSLYGPPQPTGRGVRITGNVVISGPALLQDLTIDGCVLVDRANRVELVRVWVEHCSSDGITLQSNSGPGGNQSCCAKLDHVVSTANAGAGLRLVNTADVFISMSEFENNQECGARLNNSPTARIVNSDFGGNALCGLWADSGSGLTMLTNNQWGNNRGDDLVLESQNNILNSGEFIGPDQSGACAVRAVGAQHLGVNHYGARPVCQ